MLKGALLAALLGGLGLFIAVSLTKTEPLRVHIACVLGPQPVIFFIGA